MSSETLKAKKPIFESGDVANDHLKLLEFVSLDRAANEAGWMIRISGESSASFQKRFGFRKNTRSRSGDMKCRTRSGLRKIADGVIDLVTFPVDER